MITSPAQIPLLVETPLVPACTLLWERGIQTLASSANRLDATDPERAPYLIIDFSTLTRENMRTALRRGKLLPDGTVFFPFDAHPKSTIGDIFAQTGKLVKSFSPQPPIWAVVSLTFTLQEIQKYLLDPKDFYFYERLGLYVHPNLFPQVRRWENFFSRFRKPKEYFVRRQRRIKRLAALLAQEG